MLQKTLPKIILSFNALMVYTWISFHYYPPYYLSLRVLYQYHWDPLLLLFGKNGVILSRLTGADWVWVFRPYPKTISMSNLFGGETKGSTFCSVILRP